MIARAAIVLAILAAALPCAAQPCTVRGVGLDLRDVRVDTGGRRPVALRFEDAAADVDLPRRVGPRARLEARVRGSIEVSATIPQSSVRYVLLPEHALGGGMLQVRSIGAATIHAARVARGGGAQLDLWVDGLGALDGVSAQCDAIAVVAAGGLRGATASAPSIEGAPYPRRDRIRLRAGPGDGEAITWRPAGVTTHALEVIETRGSWQRVRATLSDASTLEAWIARRDLSATARPEPRGELGALGTIGHGSGYGCGRSHHDPSVTHAVLPRGTEIVDPATGRAWARVATERSFEVHLLPDPSRVEILEIPGVEVDGPGCGPIGVVATAGLDLFVFDRDGLRLRADRARDRFVVEALTDGATALGLEAGDEIVALDGERFDTRVELTAMGRALLTGGRVVRVRRAGRELDLPAR